MPANDTRNPDEIEREIRATQRDMSNTVNQLEEQLTPRNLLNSLLDKADESGVDARTLLDQARRNPLALGMIAIGGLWLVSDSDARPSALKPNLGGRSGSGTSASYDPDDDFHRSYVEHMRGVEHRPDEDFDVYRRRRDHARASYLMIEPRHDEDESGFRRRLDEATDRMRERREQMAERVRNMAHSARDGAGNFAHSTSEGASNMAHSVQQGTGQAVSQARSLYFGNPLLGGLLAAFVGAAAGSAIPATRTEEEQFGRMSARTLDRAKEQARQTGEQAKGAARQAGEQALQRKDEMVDKADQSMRSSETGGVSAASLAGGEYGTS